MCEVKVLFDGYSRQLNDGTMKANCSCTLIKGAKLVIVDTMTAWDRERIINALALENIKPEDVDYVVCTHSHADHIGNNNLFLNAQHIVGTCIHSKDVFENTPVQPTGYILCQNVKVIPTPGHTLEDVTVLVDSIVNGQPKKFAITGDLFEKEEDIINPAIWKDLGTPAVQNVQSVMRSRIMNLADFIIPGHGPMFSVTENMREIVLSQVIT